MKPRKQRKPFKAKVKPGTFQQRLFDNPGYLEYKRRRKEIGL